MKSNSTRLNKFERYYIKQVKRFKEKDEWKEKLLDYRLIVEPGICSVGDWPQGISIDTAVV